ncbi:hypothetical protein C8Q74DRAFT_1308021 [Fomes fomentarius]|nr:hypothetical protein C8Q74DRAFT_1308021 [Fomes fomentarius]
MVSSAPAGLTSTHLYALYKVLVTPEIVVFFKLRVTQDYYMCLSSTLLIIYEHILTAEQEYRMIWKRNFSVPCVLFLVNRYTLLLVSILNILSYWIWWQDDISCAILIRMLSILMVLLDFVNVIFMMLRMHVINNRNWYWTVSLFVIGCLAIPVNLVPSIVAYARSIVLDIMVIAITWYRTFVIVKSARKANMNTSVASVLLRDGVYSFIKSVHASQLYYRATLGMNIANIVIVIVNLDTINSLSYT